MGDFQGHPFRGNQWTKGYGAPPTSEDRAPGKDFFYHATSAKNLESIAADGLRPPKGSQNGISFAPHLDAAYTWGGLIGGQNNVLLRVKRDEVSGVDTGSDEDTGIEYDPMDEGAEVGTYRPVGPEVLEVYHDGEWKDLMEHVYSPQFRDPSITDWRRNPPKRGR